MIDFQALRNKILDKAIRGELVPQLESEPDVIQNREAPERPPFDIPEKWQWIQVKTLEVKRRTVNPGSLTCDKVELWSIPAYDKGNAQIVSPSDIGSSKKIVFAGDVLLAKIVPHIKRAWTVTEHCSDLALTKLASTEWLTYRSELFIPDFLVLLFKSPYFREKMIESVSGMGSLKRATPKALSKIWLPLPPQKEQHRILDRLNSLLTEINRVEIAYTELLTLGDIFRKQVLQKAIQGKLVPQLESEPSVEQLGQAPESVPFSIPQKWKWVQLRDIASSNVGLTYKPEDISIIGTPILRSCNIENGEVVFTDLKRISKVDIPTKCLIHEGDILMCSRNGSKSLVGKCALMSKTEEVYGFGAFMTIIRSPYNRYLKFFFESDYFRKTMLEANNTTSINQITQKKLLDVYIPLPPIGEQLRIVTRVNEIISEIKRLRD